MPVNVGFTGPSLSRAEQFFAANDYQMDDMQLLVHLTADEIDALKAEEKIALSPRPRGDGIAVWTWIGERKYPHAAR